MLTQGRTILITLLIALTATAGAAQAARHKPRRAAAPVMKSLAYAPIGDPTTQSNPQATYTFVVKAAKRAPSLELWIYGNNGNINSDLLFGTVRKGTNHFTQTAAALPAGTFKVWVVANLPGPGHRQLRGKGTATLVVSASGAGTVTFTK